MEENVTTSQPVTPKRGKSRLHRIILGIVLGVVCLVVLLPLALYVPWVQDVACRAVVSYLNETDSTYQYQVGQIRIGFPLQLQIQQVNVLTRPEGKTMLHVGLLQTGLDDIPIHQPYFVLNKLHAEDVQVCMDSLTDGVGLNGELRSLDLAGIEYQPDRYQLRLRSAIINEPDVQLYLAPSAPDSIDEPTAPWDISLERLALTGGRLRLDMSDVSLAEARQEHTVSPYLDYQHLDLTAVDLVAEAIHYDSLLIKARVDELRACDARSGLEVSQLAADFTMRDNLIDLHDVDLALAEADYLRGDATVDLAMFDSVPQGYLAAQLEAHVDSANLLRLAAPYLPGLSQHWPGVATTLAVQMRLTPDSLDLPQLRVDIPGRAEVIADGWGQHLFDNQQRNAAATLKGSLTQADFLLSAFVAEPSARDYRLPDSLQFDMEASQRGRRFTARVDLQQQGSDALRADATYDLETEAYHLNAVAHDFSLSRFMPSMIVDHLTAQVQADGRHFDFPHPHTRVDADLRVDTLIMALGGGVPDSLYALTGQASMVAGNYALRLHSQHPAMGLSAQIEGVYLKDSISARGRLDVPRAQLAHLPFGLARPDLGDLGFSSKVRLFYNGDDVAQLHLTLDSLNYMGGDVAQHFDDITIHIESEPGILDAELEGGDALVTISSDCGLSNLPVVIDSIMAEVNRQRQNFHFDFNALQRTLPQMSVDLHMARNNPFYQAFEYYTGCSFRSADLRALNAYRLSMDGEIAGLMSADGSVSFDTIAVDVRPMLDDSYRYAVHARHLDPRVRQSYDMHAAGHIMADSLTLGFTYIDGNYLTLYDIETSLALSDDSLTLHIENNPTLYEQPFTVNPDNFISLMHYSRIEQQRINTRARVKMQGPRDLLLNLYTRQNPNIENGNQLLLLVRNLDINYANKVMRWEGDAGGRYNMQASVNLFPDSLHATLRSGVRDFHLGDYHADTLSFDGVAEMAHQRRDIEGKLTVDSIVKLNVEAHLADSVQIHGVIRELPLPLANTFLPNYMHLYGQTTGRFDVVGSDFDHARADAFLTMQQAGLCYHDLDANIAFAPDTIRLRNSRLEFRDFCLTAANSNPAKLNGQIDFSKNLTDPSINLQISGQNIRLIDNKRLRLPDQYITGRLPLTPDIRVRGTLSQLAVTGSLNVLSGTNLNYYMSDDPLQSSSRVEQLVEFVDFRQIDRMIAQSDTTRRRPVMQAPSDESLNIDLRIEIANDAKVSAHLAGTDRNRVDIVGGGSMKLQTDREANLIMTGNYDINSGVVDYKLPVLPMVKTFNITSDSRVYWGGNDPTDPSIDIKATEEVKTTVNDAMGSRLVRFLVTIQLQGTLESLAMTFDCAAPEDGSINAEIGTLTAEERSKAALMLLIAQTYIGPGTTSSMGLGTANAALNSMLNREMDSMLGNMKGTNIDVGIDTYSTDMGNSRTSYSVKVSQQLFNDRFRATIGGEINSGGDVGQSQGARLGDMSLEWLIRKDGSHYLKIFRRTNYQSVLEGELIESGVSYIQERTAYRFRHLLLPNSKKRKERIQQMVREMKAKEEAEESATTSE